MIRKSLALVLTFGLLSASLPPGYAESPREQRAAARFFLGITEHPLTVKAGQMHEFLANNTCLENPLVSPARPDLALPELTSHELASLVDRAVRAAAGKGEVVVQWNRERDALQLTFPGSAGSALSASGAQIETAHSLLIPRSYGGGSGTAQAAEPLGRLVEALEANSAAGNPVALRHILSRFDGQLGQGATDADAVLPAEARPPRPSGLAPAEGFTASGKPDELPPPTVIEQGGITYKVHHSPRPGLWQGMMEACLRTVASVVKGLQPHYDKRTVEDPVPPGTPISAFLTYPSVIGKIPITRASAVAGVPLYLATDPSWLIQEIHPPDQDHPDGKTYLRLRRGYVFDEKGEKATLVTFRHPPYVNWFMQLHTKAANGIEESGSPLEWNAAFPLGASVHNTRQIASKALTSTVLYHRAGVRIPRTLAFFKPGVNPELEKQAASLRSPDAVVVPRGRDAAATQAKLDEYLASHPDITQLVLKPSGWGFHSGTGVEFFRRDEQGIWRLVEVKNKRQTMEIVPGHRGSDAVMDVANKILSDPGTDAVIINERIIGAPFYLHVGKPEEYKPGMTFGLMTHPVTQDTVKVPVRYLTRAEIESGNYDPLDVKDINIRVFAASIPPDDAVISRTSYGRAAVQGKPTAALAPQPEHAAVSISVATFLAAMQEQHGLLTGPGEAEAYMEDLRANSRRGMAALMAAERRRQREKGQPHDAITAFGGTDDMPVLVTLPDGRRILSSQINEQNGPDTGGQIVASSVEGDQEADHTRGLAQHIKIRATADAEKHRDRSNAWNGPASLVPR